MPRVAGACLALVLAAGCSTDGGFVVERKVDYGAVRTLPKLDVPPDLVDETLGEAMPVPEGATAAKALPLAGKATETGAPVGKIEVRRAGDRRWLRIGASPEVLWPRLLKYWENQGFNVKREDQRLGIMVTEWRENRADIPQGFLRAAIVKAFGNVYSAPTRDQYRIRIERAAEKGVTEVFLTHRGVEEMVREDRPYWQTRPSDPELEIEMLLRLMQDLGTARPDAEAAMAQAKAEPVRARMIDGDAEPRIELDDGFADAWRRVGDALERAGFGIEDRTREAGRYFVRLQNPVADATGGGGQAGTAYRIVVAAANGKGATVQALDADGKPLAPRAARAVLNPLLEQLR